MSQGSKKCVLLVTILLSTTIPLRADEISNLRSDIQSLLKRIDTLEKKNKHLSDKLSYQNNEILKIKTSKNEENRKLIDIEQNVQNLKDNTASKGPEEGTFYIPGTKTAVGFYGYAKAEFISENKPIGGDNSDPNYQSGFGDIVLDGAKNDVYGPQRAFTARESRIGFKTLTPTELGTISSLIEADFYGGGTQQANFEYYPRLRKAWLGLKTGAHEIIVGQTDSVFGDERGGPGDATILDFGGIVGVAGGRTPMIRYSYQISKPWAIYLGLEESQVDYLKKSLYPCESSGTSSTCSADVSGGFQHYKTYSSTSSGTNVLNRIPAFAAQLRYEQDNYHVALRGLIQQIHIMGSASSGLSDAKNTSSLTNVPSYDFRKFAGAFGVSGHYSFNESNTITLEGNYGSGMPSFSVGASGVMLDATNSNGALLSVQKAMSFAAAFEHRWTQKLKSTIGAGYLRIFNKGIASSQTINRYVQSFHANLVYEPIKNLLFGVEYAYGNRKVEQPALNSDRTFSKNHGDVHRFEIAAKYMF